MIVTKDKLADWRWRVANLYTIVDENGNKVPFDLNPEQRNLLENLHNKNVVLKARQLGFTTVICILALDQTFFNSNYTALIIAQGLREAEKIFRSKIKLAYEALPDAVKQLNPVENINRSEIVFRSGSSISVGTSARSGTLQFLHVSEYGKICRKYPEQANEIKTGALPAVHASGLVFVESTAEGTSGDFYDMVQDAQQITNHTPEDFKLHFYPWFNKKEYRISPRGAVIAKDDKDYFKELAALNIELDEYQKAWYSTKKRFYKEDVKREYPSNIEEAFSGAMEERFFHEQIIKARQNGRICNVDILPGVPINTFWDIGLDTTSIWFHQYAATEHRLVDYFEDSNKTLPYYVEELQKKGYVWGTFYLPHDAQNGKVVDAPSALGQLRELMPNVFFKVIPRIPHKYMAVESARNMLEYVYFDESRCSRGIECLENYRKKWNERLGAWSDEPVHDWASHGADSFMQLAQGWREYYEDVAKPQETNDIHFNRPVNIAVGAGGWMT